MIESVKFCEPALTKVVAMSFAVKVKFPPPAMGCDGLVKEVYKFKGADRHGVRRTERATEAKRIQRISIFYYD